MNTVNETQKKSLNFWAWWIIIIAGGNIIFGILMALAPEFMHDTLFSTYYESLFGSGTYETLTETERDFQQWAYGLAGGIIAGWMMMVAFVAYIPFRRGERWAWWVIEISMVVWFVVDSYASVASGMSINMILNILTIIALGIPLVATYRIFFNHNVESIAVPNRQHS